MIVSSGDSDIRARFARHPRVSEVIDDGRTGIRFGSPEWPREILVGDSGERLHGVPEVIDNNPLVCADHFSVPSAGCTLALLAVAPLAAANLLVEPPTVATNVAVDEHEIDAYLAYTGWAEGVTLHVDEADLGGIISATVIAAIRTPENLDEIDELYEERYGRGYFVFRDEESAWDAALVQGTDRAAYRLRIAVDEPFSLLTIRVIAELAGKAGAGQVVQVFNIMNGYEDTLGITHR